MFSEEFKNAMVKEVFAKGGTTKFHDAIYDGCGKSYTQTELKKFFKDLPEELQCLALEYSLRDTQFCLDITTCLRGGKI